MAGPHVAPEFESFLRNFAPPEQGRYVAEPAPANEHGVVYEPPAPPDKLPKVAGGIVPGVFVAAGIIYRKRKGSR